MRISYIAVIVAVFALAVSALLAQGRVTYADGHECPSGLPSQSAEGLHTDDQGKGWFLIRSSDSNGYTHVRAYAADDSYGPGYVPGSPDETCYLIVRRPGDTADAAQPTQVTFRKDREPPAPKTDDQLTMEYVQQAIAYYDEHGRAAAFDYYNYNIRESFKGERSMLIYEPDTLTVRVYPVFLDLVGSYFSPNSDFGGLLARLYQSVISGDGWIEFQTFNPVTQQSEPKRNWGVLHDGLIFTSGHFTLRENIEQATKNYVDKAIRYYDTNGLEATIAHYNSRDSLENFFYLFLMDENDIYLAHPIREDLRGTDIKDVTGTDFEGELLRVGQGHRQGHGGRPLGGIYLAQPGQRPRRAQDHLGHSL